jgi:hypothetical protein
MRMPAAGESRGKSTGKRKEPFTWVLWLVLLGSIYLFWVLPHQLPKAPVKVDFGESAPR